MTNEPTTDVEATPQPVSELDQLNKMTDMVETMVAQTGIVAVDMPFPRELYNKLRNETQQMRIHMRKWEKLNAKQINALNAYYNDKGEFSTAFKSVVRNYTTPPIPGVHAAKFMNMIMSLWNATVTMHRMHAVSATLNTKDDTPTVVGTEL